MSPTPATELPLTGADCFLRAFDDEVRRRGSASHASQLVLRLGPGFDAKALGDLVQRAAAAHPILHAPIRRRGFRPAAYQLALARPETAPTLTVHPPLAGDALPPLFHERMNGIFRGELDQSIVEIE